MNAIRVETPSRLHFGLFGWGPNTPRQFGGVGLMVDDPGLVVEMEPAETTTAEGLHALRVVEVVERVRTGLAAQGVFVPSVRLRCVRAPESHVGLGLGTQLSLAIARAVTTLAGLPEVPVEELARLGGRGLRSGIGIHGFDRGGFLVDGGRRGGRDVPSLLLHLSFPADWRVLLVLPEQHYGVHGPAEIQAFRDLPPLSSQTTDRLMSLVLLGLVAGIREHDLSLFGEALQEIQQIIGASFAPAQGGCFSDPMAVPITSRMKSLGLMGVGQSSWGPALYGFAVREKSYEQEMLNELRREPYLRGHRLLWTQANARGAQVSPLG